MLTLVAVYWVRTSETLQATVGIVWLVCLASGTFRMLKHLEAMESEHPAPTDAMKQLFHVTMLLPMVGSAPLLLVFTR
jgi:hypothetical protein